MVDELDGMRVLVTGARGFVGRHLCRKLQEANASIFLFSRILGFDFTHEAKAMAAVLACKPDTVIHLAAPPFKAPSSSWIRDSLLMGMNLMTACSISGAKLVLVNRSGTNEERAVQEALLWSARAHLLDHQLKFVQVVSADLYGPGDSGSSHSVVNGLLDGIGKRGRGLKEVKLQGHPKLPCELLYVEDAADAILKAAALPSCTEPLHLVPRQVLRLEELAATIAEKLDFKGKILWESKDRLWHAPRERESLLVKEILDWDQTVLFEEGIDRLLAPVPEPTQKAEVKTP